MGPEELPTVVKFDQRQPLKLFYSLTMEASNPAKIPRKKAKDGVKKTGKKTGKKTAGKKKPTSSASAVPVATHLSPSHPVSSQYAPTYTPIPQTQTVVFEKPGKRVDLPYNGYNITTMRLIVLRSS